MTPARLLVAAFIVWSSALAGGEAFAQDEAARQRMLELNEAGFAAFQKGQFAQAASSFAQAYALVPDPNLRKNEAIAWFKAGDCARAITAANAFLIARETEEPDRLEARSVIANCKVEMAGQAMQAKSYDLAEQLLDEADSLQPDAFARDQISIRRVELAKHRAGLASDGTPGSSRALGYTLVGVGTAILAGTVAYHLTTRGWSSEVEDLSESGADPERLERLQSRVDLARNLYVPLYAAGVLTTGVGVYMILRPASHAPAPGADEGPVVTFGFIRHF